MIGPPRWVEPYLRIPFASHGWSKMGCHCWGLVVLVYKEKFGVDLPLFDFVRAEDVRAMIKSKQSLLESSQWQVVNNFQDYRDYDVALMLGQDEEGSTLERHVGLIAGKYVLHIEDGIDSRCEPLFGAYFRSRVVRTIRYKLL